MTVTISSLVYDMLLPYQYDTRLLPACSWRPNVPSLVEEFIYTRDCWYFLPLRAPAVKATFSVQYGMEELTIDIAFASNPARVGFDNLCNIVAEGDEFKLKPTLSIRIGRANLPVGAEYFFGPARDGWMQWDGLTKSFRGTVSPTLASSVGAERFDSYTIPLHLTTRVTHHFPGEMRFERVIRCIIPVTVKRRPDRCAIDQIVMHDDKEESQLSADHARVVERKDRAELQQRVSALPLARLHDAGALNAHPPSTRLSTDGNLQSRPDEVDISRRRDSGSGSCDVRKSSLTVRHGFGIEQTNAAGESSGYDGF